MRDRKKSKRILLWAALASVLIGIYLLLFPEREAFQRQELEQELADSYLKELEEDPTKIKQRKTEQEEIQAREAEQAWEDNVWYIQDGIRYTPDYARGMIQCVLEIPSVKIRRGVYGGTWEDIRHDLDIWMVTAARPDYELGKTHYCIYGHNHSVQNLSFNRLKEVKKGDIFTLKSEKGVFTYRISRVFAEWRETVTKEYVDNFDLDSGLCYIITCGREENRYRDLVVEGKRMQKELQ